LLEEGEANMVDEPNEEDLVELLREKVKHKMDIARTMGLFSAAIFGASLSVLAGDGAIEKIFLSKCKLYIASTSFGCMSDLVYNWAFNLAIMAMIMSIPMFFATMFVYDRILMPSQYWSVNSSAEHPDKHSHRMHRYMINAWSNLFIPAMLCFYTAIFTYIIGILKPDWIFSAIILILFLLPNIFFWLLSKPELSAPMSEKEDTGGRPVAPAASNQ